MGSSGNGSVGLFELEPTPVPVTGGYTFAAISAGRDHTCGVTGAGAAYCWGADNTGDLGRGGFVGDGSIPAPGDRRLELQRGQRRSPLHLRAHRGGLGLLSGIRW